MAKHVRPSYFPICFLHLHGNVDFFQLIQLYIFYALDCSLHPFFFCISCAIFMHSLCISYTFPLHFFMHSLCIAYAFLMHFLCISQAFLMHFLKRMYFDLKYRHFFFKMQKKCKGNASEMRVKCKRIPEDRHQKSIGHASNSIWNAYEMHMAYLLNAKQIHMKCT